MQQLYTSGGSELPDIPWAVYPRPQLVRKDWLCLNGTWSFSGGSVHGDIIVPFCPESLLSGQPAAVSYGTEMVYRRSFTVPDDWIGRRVLLHFGAVNRVTDVLLNGVPVARHDNGYLPFEADVTDHLIQGENKLAVHVINDLSHRYPWGKQKIDRGGMWYTPVSGIWQTVWLEPVPKEYIRTLSIRTGADYADITIEGASSGVVIVDGQRYPLERGTAHVTIAQPVLWTPETPHLYRFTIECGEDRVNSYFALRTLSVKNIGGIPRLCLNGKPYFFNGVLDQGYWSDGLYTPASPEDFQRDILAMKALGFNTLRKHIKIEPELFYYECDRLGMIVFQDMVNCGEYRYLRDTVLPTLGLLRRHDHDLNRDMLARDNFLRSMDGTVTHLQNHPCICLWTIFNEGWGQFCADDAYRRLRTLDDSRFIDSTSGWFHQRESDVDSLHIYFKKLRLGRKSRPQLLSEFGGWCYKLPEHSFNLEKTYGYRKFSDYGQFLRSLRELYENQLLPLVSQGLCGAIYTQLSDVEDETNGFYTYDRKVLKVDPADFSDIAKRLQKAVST